MSERSASPARPFHDGTRGAGELFDVERLARLVERELAGGTPLAAVPAAIFAEIERFSGRHDDDWTLLLVERSVVAAAGAA